MKMEKMSLANMQGKMGRQEMKNIMGGANADIEAKCNDGCAPGPNSKCPSTCPCTNTTGQGGIYKCIIG